jgi:glucokinase
LISEAGVRGSDRACVRTMELFVSLYGAAAGNLALVARAIGGTFLAGGIPPKILPLLKTGLFVTAFRTKGRLSPLLDTVPIKVVLEKRAALLGAAACAADLQRRPR